MKTMALLMVAVISGCATAPQRYSDAALASASDQQVCEIGFFTDKNHPDAQAVLSAYRARLVAGRFTHERCKAHVEAVVVARKAKQEQTSKEIADFLLFSLGALAAGAAAGYANSPAPAYSPTPVRAPQQVVQPMPTLPKMLLTREADRQLTNGIFMVTCRYAGSNTVIRVPMHEPCPSEVPQ